MSSGGLALGTSLLDRLESTVWVYEVLPHAVLALLAFAIGACLGSFANVLIVRLPIGMSVVAPPSRCPTCGVRLRWHENLPVIGWLVLRGRCRACGVSISPQYLLMEVVCGLALAWIYLVHFATPPHAPWWSELAGPWWSRNGPLWALPAASVQAALFVALLAMTKIDARAFVIPMVLPTTLVIVALLLWLTQGLIPSVRGTDSLWPLERLGWPATTAAFGGSLGVALSIALLKLGALRPSFADYDEFLSAQRSDGGTAAVSDADGPPRDIPLELQFLAPLAASVAVGLAMNGHRILAGLLAVLALAALLLPVASLRGDQPVADEAPLADYPHARREVLREVLFLLPCILGLCLGWMLGSQWGEDSPPVGVLGALGPSLMGFLVGGGIVWGVRILATLVLGREAMGLGDVHLLAAVGAAAGPMVATSAFFIAPFLGLAWVGAAALLGGRGALQQGGLPFGPHLALGAVAAVALKPALTPLVREAAAAFAVLGGAAG